jgi:hypothetical protein
MGKKANENEPKPRELKWALGDVHELTVSPMQTWDALKGGEAVQNYGWNICKKQSLNNSKGVMVGTVEHTGLARLVKDPATNIIYLSGEIKSTHKIIKNGHNYIVDSIADMDQQVELDTVQTNATGRLIGSPDFSNLRITSLTQNGISLQHIASKSSTTESPWWRILHFPIIFHSPIIFHFPRTFNLPSWYNNPIPFKPIPIKPIPFPPFFPPGYRPISWKL